MPRDQTHCLLLAAEFTPLSAGSERAEGVRSEGRCAPPAAQTVSSTIFPSPRRPLARPPLCPPGREGWACARGSGQTPGLTWAGSRGCRWHRLCRDRPQGARLLTAPAPACAWWSPRAEEGQQSRAGQEVAVPRQWRQPLGEVTEVCEIPRSRHKTWHWKGLPFLCCIYRMFRASSCKTESKRCHLFIVPMTVQDEEVKKKCLDGKAVIIRPKSRHRAVLSKGRAVVTGVWFVAQSFSVLKYSLTPWHLNQINSVNPSKHRLYGCGGSWRRARIHCLASELLIQGEEERQIIKHSVADTVSGLCLGTGPKLQPAALCCGCYIWSDLGHLPFTGFVGEITPAWAGPPRLQLHLELPVWM